MPKSDKFEQTDKEIMRLVQKGDYLGAIAVLIKGYNDFVFTIGMHFLGNQSDVEDITQEVFEAVYKNFQDGRYEDRGELRAWLGKVAQNKCLEFLRKKKRHREIEKESRDDIERIGHSDQPLVWEQYAVKQLELACLKESLDKLTRAERKLITDRYYKNLALENIAAGTGRSRTAITKRIETIKKRLKDMVEECINGSAQQL